MRLLRLPLQTVTLILIIAGKITGQEIEVEMVPAYEVVFDTEWGKYYEVQSSQDMVNWWTEMLFKGTSRGIAQDTPMGHLTSTRLFPAKFFRVIESDIPPAKTAPLSLEGKKLDLVEYYPFAEPETKTLAFSTLTAGTETPGEGGSAEDFTYLYLPDSFNVNVGTFIRLFDDGSRQQIRLIFLTETTGYFSGQTLVAGSWEFSKFYNFTLSDL